MLGSGKKEPGPKFIKKLSIETKSFNLKVPLPKTERMLSMLTQDYISKILDMEDVIIRKVEQESEELHVYLELPRTEHACPCCGNHTHRIHDYRWQKVKDIPFGRTTYIHIRKRRYICENCGKRFYEKNPFLARYHRTTRRVVAAVINSFKKLQPAKEIASLYNISITTAIRYFDYVEHSCTHLPSVLSIDEFKGNAGGEKYQCIVTDVSERKIIDILPNRFESTLSEYFKKFSDREHVKFFVIDMNPHFRNVAKTCFPRAVIVADRYHVIRQVIWAMENVRKAEQKKLSKKFRKYFKKSRYLLNKPIDKLTEEESERLALMFEISPRLAQAYKLKNFFLLVMHSDPKDAPKLLGQWLLLAESYQFEEFENCITAYHNWSSEILNAIRFSWSNGFTEGCNNKIKVLKRICFGVRNFSRFRNRILHCST